MQRPPFVQTASVILNVSPHGPCNTLEVTKEKRVENLSRNNQINIGGTFDFITVLEMDQDVRVWLTTFWNSITLHS